MNKILVIKLGSLGDIILAMEAFQAIREHHPNSEITLMTRPQFTGFTQKMPWFDSIIEDTMPKWYQVSKWRALRNKVRSLAFDRVYDLQGNSRTNHYFKLFGKARSEWCGPTPGCSHQRVGYNTANLPSTERLLRFLESLDLKRPKSLNLAWLTGDLLPFQIPDRFVLLIPGSSPQHPHKRWPAIHFAKLINQLEAQQVGAVLIGTGAEREQIHEIMKHAPSAINLCEKTGLGEIAELARRSQAVVGNDTGPTHMAGIVGATTRVLMSGNSDPVRMRPRGEDVECLQREDLSQLNADEVFHALKPYLGAK